MKQQHPLTIKFKEYLIQRMTNEKTAKNYIAQVNKFLCLYYIYTEPRDEKELLDNAKKFITLNARAYDRKYALGKFFDFLNKSHLYDLLPKTNPLVRKQKVKRLLFSDVKTLVNFTTDEALKVIIMLQYSTASRISAILGIHLEDITYDEKEKLYKITMREKGEQIRTVYLDTETSHQLFEFIKKNNIRSGKIFRGINYYFVWKQLKLLSKKLLRKNISSHWFRHSRIMELVDKGYHIEDIQKLTGHKSLDSLRKYMLEAGVETKVLAKKEAPTWG